MTPPSFMRICRGLAGKKNSPANTDKFGHNPRLRHFFEKNQRICWQKVTDIQFH